MISQQSTELQFDEFVTDVRNGLTRVPQKILRSQYLYDDIGSALFEVITLLPEYGLTRADERLLDRHASDLSALLSSNVVVAELGSGSGVKTRRILTELTNRGGITYFPIDISVAALERCRTELQQVQKVRIDPLAYSYMDGLREAVDRAPGSAQLLLLFLGSTIGNFDRPVAIEFLRDIRSVLRAGDVMLFGTDMEKPIPQLLAAYDDPAGVTAAFNKNIIARINRELGGDFDLAEFEHVAVYNEAERRIEMHLNSCLHQKVHIPAAKLTVNFRKGETIWTESSHKFNCEEIVRMATETGFRCDQQWVDEDWPFAENVLVAE